MFAERYAYTWSLLAFVLPLLLMVHWLRRHAPAAWADVAAHGPATLAVLVPMGLALNLMLADVLFVYPQCRAVIGLRIEVPIGADRVGVPVEEYLFYVFGFSFILMSYVFFAHHSNAPNHTRKSPRAPSRTLKFVFFSGCPTIAAALILRPDAGIGTPVYLQYLVVLPLALTMAFARRACRSLDRAGFACCAGFTIALSFVMEALLALPRGWWGYNPAMMCGIDLMPGLPIEAVLVWVLSATATPIVFETIRGGQTGEANSPRERCRHRRATFPEGFCPASSPADGNDIYEFPLDGMARAPAEEI
jgi:hypothetical protein